MNLFSILKQRLIIKTIVVFALLSVFPFAVSSQSLSDSIPEWFGKAKFGVFVHFAENGHFRYYTDANKVVGLEHNKAAYKQGAKDFTLSQNDVLQWTKYIKKWGAKYAVLTTKHRPGFALWPTKVHKRNTVDMSPSKLDIVKAWTDGLRNEGIKVGYYFSHYDWGDEDFILAKNPPSLASDKDKKQAWEKYLLKRDKMVKELVSQYGKIDLLWWDEDWCAKDYKELGSDKMLDMVFEYQPEVVINNRNRHPWRWHYSTPEKFVPLNPKDIPWETCDNLVQNNSWGYKLPNGKENYKKPEDVLFTFLEVLSGGGNYLLNIGPKPDGSIPEEELKIMNYVGEFINQYEEAIFETSRGIPRYCFGDPSTIKGNELFLFALNRPICELTLKGVSGEIKEIVHLKTGKKLAYRLTGGRESNGKAPWIRIAVPASEDKFPEVYKIVFEGEFTVVK